MMFGNPRTSSADGVEHMAIGESKMSSDRPRRVAMGGRLERTSSAEARVPQTEGARLSRTASNDSSSDAASVGGRTPLLAAMGRLSRTASSESIGSKKLDAGEITRTSSSESTARASGMRRGRISRTASSESSMSEAESLRAATATATPSSAQTAPSVVPQRRYSPRAIFCPLRFSGALPSATCRRNVTICAMMAASA